MKRLIFTLLSVIMFNLSGSAQSGNPCAWKFFTIKKSATVYELHLSAKIEGDWHIYSQHMESGGPLPTVINFKSNPLLQLLGKTEERGKMIKKKEEVFDMVVKYFDDTVEFVQLIRLKSPVKTNVSGTVEFMLCKEDQCLPPTKQSFSMKLD
jgi:hypothetical protein